MHFECNKTNVNKIYLIILHDDTQVGGKIIHLLTQICYQKCKNPFFMCMKIWHTIYYSIQLYSTKEFGRELRCANCKNFRKLPIK